MGSDEELGRPTSRLLTSVIASVTEDIAAVRLETQELFVLAAVDEHPYPQELA